MKSSGTGRNPATFIKNSRLLTDLFGYWPEFHDAEIVDLFLSVGCAKPWIPGCDSPNIEMKLELCDWNGSTARTLVEMYFGSVREVELTDFSYQNSVEEILFHTEPRQLPDGRGGMSAPFDIVRVEIIANCGLTAKFECKKAEVISATMIAKTDEETPI